MTKSESQNQQVDNKKIMTILRVLTLLLGIWLLYKYCILF